MSLYLIVMIATIMIPLAFSFEKNLKLYKRWRSLIPAIILTMIPFIIWDSFFIYKSYWGINEQYITGIYFLNLPLEECLFFIAVPYACIFTIYAVKFHFPVLKLGMKAKRILTACLILIAIVASIVYRHNMYSLSIFILFICVLVLCLLSRNETLQYYYAIFPILLIPFFIINGILSGTGIDKEVVWYHPEAITGVRLITIPIEDVIYAFVLVLSVLVLTEWLEKKYKINR